MIKGLQVSLRNQGLPFDGAATEKLSVAEIASFAMWGDRKWFGSRLSAFGRRSSKSDVGLVAEIGWLAEQQVPVLRHAQFQVIA